MTEYIILRSDNTLDHPHGWNEIGETWKASSSRRALAAARVDAGEYVAIPVRSWKPLTVTVEQTTKVTIS